jgi:colanic acid/amylovoran biosynthesis glycosyltransferase
MRIAYVVPAWPPLASQPFVVNEMLALQDAGHEVWVVPLYPGPPPAVRHGTFARLRPAAVLPAAVVDAAQLAAALRVVVARPVRTLRTLAGLHRAAGLNPWAHLRLLAVAPKALAAGDRLARAGVRRIHAHFAVQTADCAAVAGLVAGIPFSFTAHAYDIYSRRPRLRNATLGWKLRHAAQAFTVNEFAAGLLRRALPPDRRDRVQTAYVGIPLDLFRCEPPPAADGGLELLCVARFQAKKGLDTLVAAAALLRDAGVGVHVRIFGDGPLRATLAAQIARLGVGDLVELGGPLAQEAVAERMRACHAFVMPCRQDETGDMDGIPTVFMEAMATGRPVVSCPVSGIPELVRDGETGLLVPCDDPPALAAAIRRLAADEALRLRLGTQGRALVERQHDQRKTVRRLLTLMGFSPDAGVPDGRRAEAG